MKRLAWLAAAVLFPAAAIAAQTPYHTTLVKALDAPRDVIIGSTMWHCEATACVTTSRPIGIGTVPACHSLAQKMGAISAYGTDNRPFDADSLAKCNAQ